MKKLIDLASMATHSPKSRSAWSRPPIWKAVMPRRKGSVKPRETILYCAWVVELAPGPYTLSIPDRKTKALGFRVSGASRLRGANLGFSVVCIRFSLICECLRTC